MKKMLSEIEHKAGLEFAQIFQWLYFAVDLIEIGFSNKKLKHLPLIDE